jgi:XTP/dITP diphosphohydrolase
MITVYACSSNPGKLREFALVATEINASDISLLPLPGLKKIPPPDETGDTFQENAIQKAIYYSQFTGEIVLADDSGIEVAALNNAPGVHSARYAGPNATNQDNNALLLANMQGKKERSARFVCAVALAQAGQNLAVAYGTVDGELLEAPRGTNGFGYDPLFFYPPFRCSFGELDDTRKFKVSHRGVALRTAIEWLKAKSQ